MKALEKYPLPAEEQSELVKVTVLSEVLILGVALVLLIITNAVVTGDPIGAFLHGWLDSILWAIGPNDTVNNIVPLTLEMNEGAVSAFDAAQATGASLTAQASSAAVLLGVSSGIPLGNYLLLAAAFGLLGAVVLFGLLLIFSALGKRFSKSYQKSLRDLRQGITGELVRLPMRTIVPCMALAGFAEELCFRFVLLNLAIALFRVFLPLLAAEVVALVVVSIAFWLLHEQYRDPFSSAVAICGGLLLGAAYLITGWILVPMIAHALYNIFEIAYEQHRMVKEPDYFFGKVPNDLVRRLNASVEAESNDTSSEE